MTVVLGARVIEVVRALAMERIPVGVVTPTGDPARASGRWRANLLARLHPVLGADPPLRLLNVAEYACASIPRALSTVRCAVLEHTEDALVPVSVPTLVVRPEKDHLSSADWARNLVARLPDAWFVGLPGLPHSAFHGAPDVVADVVAPFLAGASPAPAAEPTRSA